MKVDSRGGPESRACHNCGHLMKEYWAPKRKKGNGKWNKVGDGKHESKGGKRGRGGAKRCNSVRTEQPKLLELREAWTLLMSVQEPRDSGRKETDREQRVIETAGAQRNGVGKSAIVHDWHRGQHCENKYSDVRCGFGS